MKRTILFAASALIMSASFGQTNIRIGQHGTTSSWRPNTAAPVAATATSVAPAYVQEIIAAVGLKPSFELTASTQVPNAAAVVYGGKRYLLYNPTFINNLVRQTGTKWAAVSVLAHEIGHHLNGHTVTGSGSQPVVELEADEFSGFVLRKLGASLTDAQVAMKTLATATASRTHPAQYDRLSSIAKGWQDADDQIDGRYVAKVPDFKPAAPAVVTPSRQNSGTIATNRGGAAQPTLSNRNILGAITFNADPNSQYYVTSQYNVVKVRNNQVAVIAKLSRLNSRNYPYVITDNETQLLVDARGTILTRQGRQVGTLTAANAYNGYAANN
ncbi:MAG: rane-binding protein [Flaviaesturariibacter sp.]|nr:rane-binding protein [Flaviaesturariibacter sp.]